MENRLDDRLMQCRQRVRAKQKLASMLRQCHETVGELQSQRATLRQVLEKEKSDVDRLEGMGLSALFHTVLGTKTEKLDRERQEFLAAKLKHDEADLALQDAKQEVSRLTEELRAYEGDEAEYQRLLQEKETLLKRTHGAERRRLFELAETLAERQSECDELREAIAAGDKAADSLRKVNDALGSAANWGTWDMVGGGTISTLVKHSKIESAKQLAHDAQQHLRRFQRELAEADQRLQLALEIDGFSKFADYFFDGLIADWIVQSKIHDATKACSDALTQVRGGVRKCERTLKDREQEIERITGERREVIEKAPLA